ncbi:MAG: metallophosphoesterase [Candidatus Tectomicrobia bacterium]|nr:metallophosphoesterase [Candidatus Tectomicrobia bacterium]
MMERSWPLRALSVILSLPLLFVALLMAFAEQDSKAVRIIAFGDDEGVTQRPGRDLNRKNLFHRQLIEHLKTLEQKGEQIDLILHTGDFVRFDPGPDLYIESLGPLLEKFYPTTGGDEEFLQGHYTDFIKRTPHLWKLVEKRIEEDGNSSEYYYYTRQKGVHILSLFSPDEYGEPGEYKSRDFFQASNKELPQYMWLLNTLERIRNKEQDDGVIIVLSHRPIFNYSKHLVELFDKYHVDLVLGGNIHVYAKQTYKNTLYIVTGITGDWAVGGCERLNENLSPDFIVKYDPCLPEKFVNRRLSYDYVWDHYLDITVRGKEIDVKVVQLKDFSLIEQIVHKRGK